MFTHVTLLILVFIINIPILSMVGTAFKGMEKALTTISLFPKWGEWDLTAFKTVIFYTSFPNNIKNSLIVATAVTCACIAIAATTGYAISRSNGKFFSFYGTFLLLLQIFPAVLLLLPLFVLYSKLGLTNTLYSLMLSYTTTSLAFSTWMMIGFFDSIPKELEESAEVDGCTRFQTFYRIILPTSLPGIATVGIFTFIHAWNEYTLASILVRKTELATMTIGLQAFVQQFTSDWSMLMAASSLAIIPTLVLMAFAQKYLVQGMTAGAVKG